MGLMVLETLFLGKWGEAHSIMPQFLKDKDSLRGLTSRPELWQNETAMLGARRSLCIALPGGLGTLEEISASCSCSRCR